MQPFTVLRQTFILPDGGQLRGFAILPRPFDIVARC